MKSQKHQRRRSRRPGLRPAVAAALGFVGLVAMTATAYAQTTAPLTAVGRSGRDLGASIISTLVFGALGIVLAIVGFKLFDVVIKHNIENEIFEGKNMAAALLAGAVILGVSVIVAATILSP